MKVYTARISYTGRDKLNITVLSAFLEEERIFIPTWDMVMSYKRGEISWDEYSRLYHDLMVQSYRKHRAAWDELLRRKTVTLACYCSDHTHCHRSLLAGYLVELGAEYGGERG